MMNELSIKQVSDEVFLAIDDIVRFDRRAIDFIKAKALSNPRGRARICAHKSSQDSLHEMLIAIQSNSYIRPHRHHNKIESFHLIEGRADIVIFDDEGTITDVVKLSADHNFYYRLNTPRYHTLIIHSPVLVIHEITNGPFDVAASDFATFSPADNDKVNVDYYVKKLIDDIGFLTEC
jgi:cupin fold WbuC family metalloprotein